MIYTLTPNPAIDMNISTDGLKAKQVNRTFDTVYTPNGKGLNVTFVLGHFGIPSGVLGFFGGFSGNYIIDETRDRGYSVYPVMVEDTTRINIFLNDGTQEYKLVNSGSFVTEERQAEMLRILEDLPDMEYLTINGSLPPGIAPSFYDKVFEVCRKKGTRVILDVSSDRLPDLLSLHPLLIKPNDEELMDIFGLPVTTDQEAAEAMRELHRKGAENVLLTLGDKGAYFSNGKALYRATAQPVKLLSSACAGDSALAAFLSIWLFDREKIEEAMKLSAATGANVAESNAIGTLEKVETYRKNIRVRKVTDL